MYYVSKLGGFSRGLRFRTSVNSVTSHQSCLLLSPAPFDSLQLCAPYATCTGIMESSGLSSPDLLGQPPTNPLASPVRPGNRAFTRTPQKQVVNTANNGNIKLQDFYLTTPPAGLSRQISPTKSVAQTENLVSPWRIRVTVEAEKNEEEERSKMTPRKSSTPSRQPRGKAVTTKVPLKGGDETPAQGKRGRGRGRGSTNSPIKRPGTPNPRSRKKVRDETIEEEGDTVDPEPSTPTITKLSKTTTNKNGTPKATRGSGAGAPDPTNLDQGSVDLAKDPVSARTRRKSQNLSLENNIVSEGAGVDGDISAVENSRVNVKAPKVVNASTRATRDGSVNEVQGTQLPTSPLKSRQPLASTNPPQQLSKAILEQKGNPEHNNSDPTANHREFDSIIESENFSIVSLASLPSAQQHLTSVPRPSSQEIPLFDVSWKGRDDSEVNAQKPLQARSPKKQSEIQNLQSGITPSRESPHSKLNGAGALNFSNTPALNRDSSAKNQLFPSLPPSSSAEPEPKSSKTIKNQTSTTPRLSRVVRAGIALQGAIDPAETGRRAIATDTKVFPQINPKTPRERYDDIFKGFGVKTRRELRAALRFGEELAKRERSASKVIPSVPDNGEDIFQEIAAATKPQFPGPKEERVADIGIASPQVHYPQLPAQQLLSPEDSQDDSNRMSWRVDTLPNITMNANKMFEKPVDRNIAREAEYQKEREEVSRKIEAAGKDRVTTIDSDESVHESEEDYDDNDLNDVSTLNEESAWNMPDKHHPTDHGKDETDIWQSEAKSLSQLHEGGAKDSHPLPSDENRPRRSKLPSPWRKRGTESQIIYSDEVSPEESRKTESGGRKRSSSPDWAGPPKHAKSSRNDNHAIEDGRISRFRFPDGGMTLAPAQATEHLNRTSAEPETDSSAAQGKVPLTGKRGRSPDPPLSRKCARHSSLDISDISSLSDLGSSSGSKAGEPDGKSPMNQHLGLYGSKSAEMKFQRQLLGGRRLSPTEEDMEDEEVDEDKNEIQHQGQYQDVDDDIKSEYGEKDEDEENKAGGKDIVAPSKANYQRPDNEAGDKEIKEASKPNRQSRDNEVRRANEKELANKLRRVDEKGRLDKRRPLNRSPVRRHVKKFVRPQRVGTKASGNDKNPNHRATAAPRLSNQELNTNLPNTISPRSNNSFQVPENSSPQLPDNGSSQGSFSAKIWLQRLLGVFPTIFAPSQEVSQKSFSWTKLISYHRSSSNRKPYKVPRLAANAPRPDQLPFTKHMPFTAAHYRRLQSIYLEAQRDPRRFAVTPDTPAAYLVGREVECMGWRKRMEGWEMGVAERFLDALARDGNWWDRGRRWERPIGVEEVAKRVFSLWAGQVQRGEVPLGGAIAGAWDERYVKNREVVLADQKAWKERTRAQDE